MPAVNNVVLAGNLTRDVEFKQLSPERAVASFGLAINRKHKGSDGNMVTATTFVRIVCWGKTAAACRDYLKKGSPVIIQGRLESRHWDDKVTGEKKSAMEVVADRVDFISSKGDAEQPAAQGEAQPAPADDDIPPFM